jgi:hypothetical protein
MLPTDCLGCFAVGSSAAFGAAGVGWPEFFKQQRQGLVQLESASGGVSAS